MTPFAHSFWIVFSTHLWRMMRARRMWVLLGLMLIPAATIAYIALMARDGKVLDALTHASWFLMMGAVLPLMGIVAGSAAVAEEIADGTIIHAFTRPVSRAGFFAGRWTAAFLTLAVVIVPAIALSGIAVHHRAASHPEGEMLTAVMPQVLAGMLLGALVYSALFAAIGTFFRRPVIVGIGYAMVFEALFANLPGKTAGLSVQHHLRSWMRAADPDLWFIQAQHVQAPMGTGGVALENLMLALGASLVFGMIVISRKQYLPGK